MSLAITGVDTEAITGVDDETNRQYLTIHPKVHAHVVLTQMNITQGLSTFGKKGSEAISKELRLSKTWKTKCCRRRILSQRT